MENRDGDWLGLEAGRTYGENLWDLPGAVSGDLGERAGREERKGEVSGAGEAWEVLTMAARRAGG